MAFELTLIASLVVFWSLPAVRVPLLVGGASHVRMRLRSAVDFFLKALAFEQAEAGPVTQARPEPGPVAAGFGCPSTSRPAAPC